MTQVLSYIRLYVYTLFGHRLYGWREMAMTVLTSVSIFSVTVSLCVFALGWISPIDPSPTPFLSR
jgi:hypothetical protein